ncbi:S8 family serine peptidase [Marinibactrum halimedae]|uniref:Peptidase S8 n=1 Tax=Marinibactrum halimedae TaxID=1444977 RepID=A0AA37T9A6_9GAMM|nr:S8 family serine peptidase [Marinibactrum halimedae]MCD9457885.1 S8 family serine peptidase [Marinibactrum halimedae]GLS26291.1 peptidase S8 [Marinibactrum halimedae]
MSMGTKQTVQVNSFQRNGKSSAGGKLSALVVAIAAGHSVFAQAAVTQVAPEKLDSLTSISVPGGLMEVSGENLSKLKGAFVESGKQHVMVKFPSATASDLSSSDRAKAFSQQADAVQEKFIADIKALAPSAQVLGKTRLAANAVYLDVDVKELPAIADRVDIEYVVAVADYQPLTNQTQLDETVSHVGGAILQATGFTGKGVEIAVIDSGIDYTHAAFGGPGTLEAYTFANEDPVNTDGVFPTEKVIGGYDFIGEWPDEPLSEDGDPLDTGGHGTHVADIAAGLKGMAPDAKLHALKVCRRFCSGVGIMRSIEYSMDPNGDGDPSDAVDIINLSLGADYGLAFDDDASAAIDRATELGILSVAAAGNDADKPFILATPSAAKTALSVAWTTSPGAFKSQLTVENGDGTSTNYDAILMGFSPEPEAAIATDMAVSYGDGNGSALNGCDTDTGENPFVPDSLTGKVVMVDRGACTFVEKVENIQEAGGVLAIVAQNRDEAPFSGGGSSNATIPSVMIAQSTGDLLRDNATLAYLDPANRVSLAERMEVASSRGPDSSYSSIKPEIGAPGRSVSAVAGAGEGVSPFSGTSGATPVVAGAAAQILEKFPHWGPAQVKSALVSTGERDIYVEEGELAPITRIGGGELRVDQAINTPLAIYDVSSHFASETSTLPFGFVEVTEKTTLQKTLSIKNITDNETLMLTFEPEFRYESDALAGAVSIDVMNQIELGYGAETSITVSLTIDPSKLPNSTLNSGAGAQDSEALGALEFDGYLLIKLNGDREVAVPWHVIARKASEAETNTTVLNDEFETIVEISNQGSGFAALKPFNLYALGEDLPEGLRGEDKPIRDLRALGSRAYPSEQCADSFKWEIGLNSWEPVQVSYHAQYEILVDLDNDGTDDFMVTNLDFNDFVGEDGNDGRNVVAVQNLETNTLRANFFTQHAANSRTTVLEFCGELMGLSEFPESPITLTPRVNNGGSVQGAQLPSVSVWPGNERYHFITEDGVIIEQGGVASVTVHDMKTEDGAIGAFIQTNRQVSLANGAIGYPGAKSDNEVLLVTAPGVSTPISQDCGDMGVAYTSDNSFTVYLKDQGWPTDTGYKYLCANGGCYQGELQNGFYQKTFNGSLGQEVSLEFKVKLANGGEFRATDSEVFSKDSCLLPK